MWVKVVEGSSPPTATKPPLINLLTFQAFKNKSTLTAFWSLLKKQFSLPIPSPQKKTILWEEMWDLEKPKPDQSRSRSRSSDEGSIVWGNLGLGEFELIYLRTHYLFSTKLKPRDFKALVPYTFDQIIFSMVLAFKPISATSTWLLSKWIDKKIMNFIRRFILHFILKQISHSNYIWLSYFFCNIIHHLTA